MYSNRDAVYNDIAAPGDGIFSTIPSNLVVSRAGCADHPYSDCGSFEFRDAIGTSFAAPQVSAAAALLLGVDPGLSPDQVSWLLERSADDSNVLTGCAECPVGRDKFTGWGRLDIQAALTMLGDGTALPRPDRYEPNDEAGPWAHALPPLPRTIEATLDYWDDNVDVYRVYLVRGQRLFARLTPDVAAHVALALWAPKTKLVEGISADAGDRLLEGRRVGAQSRLAYSAPATGTYYLELKLVTKVRSGVPYRLSLVRTSAR